MNLTIRLSASYRPSPINLYNWASCRSLTRMTCGQSYSRRGRSCKISPSGTVSVLMQQIRKVHCDEMLKEKKTITEVIELLSARVGATASYQDKVDRTFLLDLLPKSQAELPGRRMKDSWDCAIVPLGSDVSRREKYITFLGGVRVGRLLEDLDAFAVWVCFKHIENPHAKEGCPSPYSVVTALVDRMDFHGGVELRGDRDIRVEGHVSWVGKSSLEVTLQVKQEVEAEWKQVTSAVFVMVARDPLNQGSAPVNPLRLETEEEQRLFRQGEVNILQRKMMRKESLFIAPPNETEKSLVHGLFMQMADEDQLSFTPKQRPENSVWMSDTKLKNLIICHPESRNIYNKIFGGFLMRQAFELSYSNATVFSKQRPRILHIDDIMFRRPVEIGSLLYLSSEVTYASGAHVQISTKASVMDAVTQTSSLTNIFNLTFQVPQDVRAVIPRTYHEAMLYLDGRRHYQISRGIKKFYAQGE